jgi:hypothetical protein
VFLTRAKQLNLGEGEKTVYAGDAGSSFVQAPPVRFMAVP